MKSRHNHNQNNSGDCHEFTNKNESNLTILRKFPAIKCDRISSRKTEIRVFVAASFKIFFSFVKEKDCGSMEKIIYREESFRIIGICFEVYNNLGPGFLEIVYKDALEYEFIQAGIPFNRERMYEVNYKNTILRHRFYADFVVYDKIILESKVYPEYLMNSRLWHLTISKFQPTNWP